MRLLPSRRRRAQAPAHTPEEAAAQALITQAAGARVFPERAQDAPGQPPDESHAPPHAEQPTIELASEPATSVSAAPAGEAARVAVADPPVPQAGGAPVGEATQMPEATPSAAATPVAKAMPVAEPTLIPEAVANGGGPADRVAAGAPYGEPSLLQRPEVALAAAFCVGFLAAAVIKRAWAS